MFLSRFVQSIEASQELEQRRQAMLQQHLSDQ